MIDQLLNSYKSVIALDSGEMSDRVLSMLRKDAAMIAADGAANWVEADYIVGDIDSFSEAKKGGAEIIHDPDQYSTDFEKCIGFAKEMDFLPSLVIGMSGGEIDHILGNAQILLKQAEDLSLFFLDDSPKELKMGIPLSKGTFRTRVKPHATVSILPFCSCILTTKGLIWDLTDQVLTPDGLLAIRNEAAEERIEFHVLDGKALVIIDL